jgi:hypothetical protein
VTDWRIRIPIRDEAEVIGVKAISELPLLLDDQEDRAVTREVLKLWWEVADTLGAPLPVSMLCEHIESFTPAQRKQLLRKARRDAGLEDTEVVEAAERYEQASAAGRRRAAATYGQELRLAVRPGGAIVDEAECEAEAARQLAAAESRRRQQEALEADRDADVAAAGARRRAEKEQFAYELPPHLRELV